MSKIFEMKIINSTLQSRPPGAIELIVKLMSTGILWGSNMMK